MSGALRQLNVNLPAALIRECKHAAIDTDQSLSAFVAQALHRHLASLRRIPANGEAAAVPLQAGPRPSPSRGRSAAGPS